MDEIAAGINCKGISIYCSWHFTPCRPTWTIETIKATGFYTYADKIITLE